MIDKLDRALAFQSQDRKLSSDIILSMGLKRSERYLTRLRKWKETQNIAAS